MLHPHHWLDKHMTEAWRSLLRTAYAMLGMFLGLFVLFYLGSAVYTSNLGASARDTLQIGLASELAYLKTEGDAVAALPQLREYLAAEDSSHLIELLQAERTARGIGLMGAANAEGVVLVRTRTPGVLGDNTFLTTAQGRELARSGAVESIEISGFDPRQILLVTGREVVVDGRRVGGLFASHFLDDEYSKQFRDTYLPAGVEVLFYTKEFGIYGASITDSETRDLMTSYFNSGSEWVQNGESGRVLVLPDGRQVLVENVVFPGLEKSPGGALLFIPRYDLSAVARIGVATALLLGFLALALAHHRRSRKEELGWRYYAGLVAIALPIFILPIVALQLQTSGAARLSRVPFTLYNSTLRLQPDWGVYALGYTRTIGVMLDAGDEPINAVELSLSFDPVAVEARALAPSSDACAYVIDQSIDHVAGVARLSCVLRPEAATRGSLRVAELRVDPKREGLFEIRFTPGENRVLADDGLATDVLRMTQDGSYSVTGNLGSSTAELAPSLFSPSHPNQSRWYKDELVRFIWRGGADEVYYYAFDTRPETVPQKGSVIQGSVFELPVAGDGVFYFHLRRVDGGPTAHYKVQVDRTPPTIVSMRLSEERVVAGSVVRFIFDAEDHGSGIQRNYYVDLGSRLFLPVGAQLFVPFVEAGSQRLTLRVYDDAGNYTEQSKIVEVKDR